MTKDETIIILTIFIISKILESSNEYYYNTISGLYRFLNAIYRVLIGSFVALKCTKNYMIQQCLRIVVNCNQDKI